SGPPYTVTTSRGGRWPPDREGTELPWPTTSPSADADSSSTITRQSIQPTPGLISTGQQVLNSWAASRRTTPDYECDCGARYRVTAQRRRVTISPSTSDPANSR